MSLLTSNRYTIPTVEAFRGPIADDDFDIDRAQDEEEKQRARDARSSKLWRTLRVASKGKFNTLDKIDDGQNLQTFFDSQSTGNHIPPDSTDGQPPDEDQRDAVESNGIKTPIPGEAPSPKIEVNGIKDTEEVGTSVEHRNILQRYPRKAL